MVRVLQFHLYLATSHDSWRTVGWEREHRGDSLGLSPVSSKQLGGEFLLAQKVVNFDIFWSWDVSPPRIPAATWIILYLGDLLLAFTSHCYWVSSTSQESSANFGQLIKRSELCMRSFDVPGIDLWSPFGGWPWGRFFLFEKNTSCECHEGHGPTCFSNVF